MLWFIKNALEVTFKLVVIFCAFTLLSCVSFWFLSLSGVNVFKCVDYYEQIEHNRGMLEEAQIENQTLKYIIRVMANDCNPNGYGCDADASILVDPTESNPA